MTEPEHISPIASRVMADIKRRRERRQARIVSAVGDFLTGRRKPTKRHRAEKPKAETPNLW